VSGQQWASHLLTCSDSVGASEKSPIIASTVHCLRRPLCAALGPLASTNTRRCTHTQTDGNLHTPATCCHLFGGATKAAPKAGRSNCVARKWPICNWHSASKGCQLAQLAVLCSACHQQAAPAQHQCTGRVGAPKLPSFNQTHSLLSPNSQAQTCARQTQSGRVACRHISPWPAGSERELRKHDRRWKSTILGLGVEAKEEEEEEEQW